VARFVLPNLTTLHAALDRIYDLAMSLPEHPLQVFKEQTATLPRTTEIERLVVQRRGLAIFRESLLRYWSRRCPVTGITDPDLLRASHMKPWVQCETDAERLDPYNGLLLSALWDAAFDAGLVSFDDQGRVLRASDLSPAAAEQLGSRGPLTIAEKHQPYLDWHRQFVFKG
jgi:predicted restriction endonuclease